MAFGDPGAEKLTAELEQKAAHEAETLLAADGTLCLERLALMRKTFDPAFVSRVLSRAPFSALMGLPENEFDAEAMNTAMLLEDFREIRQWQDAPVTARSVFPMRLHALFNLAEPRVDVLLDFLKAALVPDSFFSAHSNLSAKPAGGRGKARTDKAEAGRDPISTHEEFRSLLRSFSRGILEGVPLDPSNLLLGGSSLAWCVRPVPGRLRRMCHMEARSHKFETLLLGCLGKKLGETSAARILWMASSSPQDVVFKVTDPAVSTCAYRQCMCRDFKDAAWDDADIDLFVVADHAAETVRKTVATLQRNIGALSGGREAVVLRTKNTLTIVGGAPFPNVQVVCKTIRNCQELLVHADVDCTAMGYDGEQVWTSTRALRAIACKHNFIPKLLLTGFGHKVTRSLARFNKYLHRGFGVLVFEHCRHAPRCDHSIPSGSLEKLLRLKAPKEPTFEGTPEKKGEELAKWMIKRSPDLRRKQKSGEEEQCGTRARDAVAGKDPLSHRIVPGDRLHVAGSSSASGKGTGKDWETSERGAPFRSYDDFMDILIPCGPGVSPDALREYVKHLDRPDLLHVVTGSDVSFAPKARSDREQWQERARGKCYMCKLPIKTKEPWPLCEECGRFNQQKRDQSADCSGMVAVVTGGRVKIGRATALRLLRAGAIVVVTTRFPRNALEHFQRESDFAAFHGRLSILAADFRRLPSVQRVVDSVLEKYEHIDILIHNAAQTIRRPAAYYESLVKREKELAHLTDQEGCESEEPARADCGVVADALALLPVHGALPLLASDAEAELRKAEWFPPGKTDAHGDQLDLRKVTSWTMKLEETETSELAEVLAVNLVVPYLLTARWLPLLRKPPSAFVVFVSSMEGSFSLPSGAKNSHHPHTNVAKAGLNMLARTIAGDLRREAIFATAVDPGWVSWMQPGGSQAVEQAPLTEDDGAARVLDPVFSGLRALEKGRSPPSGVFFKDFRVAPW